jgi:hypothetical protein
LFSLGAPDCGYEVKHSRNMAAPSALLFIAGLANTARPGDLSSVFSGVTIGIIDAKGIVNANAASAALYLLSHDCGRT